MNAEVKCQDPRRSRRCAAGSSPICRSTARARRPSFYQRAFGATEVARQPVDEKGRTMHVHLYVNGSSLMLSDPYPEYGYALKTPAGVRPDVARR